MTNEINKPTSKKISFIQTIVPILLSVMVLLIGSIAWGIKTQHTEAYEAQKIQNEINLGVLENLGTLNAKCIDNGSEVEGLLKNDRRQDLILEQHETKLNLLDK